MLLALAGCGGGDTGDSSDDVGGIGTETTSIPVEPPGSEEGDTVDLPGEGGPLAVGRKHVWVGTKAGLVRVDPKAREVVGDPEKLKGPYPLSVAVANRRVWVVSTDDPGGTGWLTGFDEDSGKPVGKPIPLAQADDIDAEDGNLWMIEGGRSLSHRDAKTGREIGRAKLTIEPNAMAIEDGVVWAQSDSDGIEGVDAETGEPVGRRPRVDPPLSDIASGEGAVWIAPDAKSENDPRPAWRIGANGPANELIHLEGPASHIAAGEGFVWIVDLKNELHRFDPTSGEEVGEPQSLPINPVTVTAGLGAFWAVDTGGATVTAVEP
jgi:hypothetical protein